MAVQTTDTKLSAEDIEHASEEDLLGEDIKCSVCLDLLQDPRLLPCLHAYCLKCLEGISSDKDSITCPQCHSNHSLPSGGVSEFPPDQISAHALHIYNTETDADSNQGHTIPEHVQCTMCTEDDPAVSYCSTCKNHLCGFCNKAHSRLVDFRSHKVTALSEMDSASKITIEQHSICCVHFGQLLKLYCKTCKKLICRDCTIVNHKSHECDFISEIRPQVQEETEKVAAALKKKQEDFEAHLAFLEEVAKKRNHYSSTVEENIKTELDSFIKIIQSHCNELLQEERSSREYDLNQITAEKEYLEASINSISNALSYVNRLCSCPSDQAMLAMQGEVTTHLSSLQSTNWSVTNLGLSHPKMFESNPHLLEECLMLNDVSLEDIKVSVVEERMTSDTYHDNKWIYQPHGTKEAQNHTVITFGEKIVFKVEIASASTPYPVLPPISILSYNSFSEAINHTVGFSCEYSCDGEWIVEFHPPHCGLFGIVVAKVRSKQSQLTPPSSYTSDSISKPQAQGSLVPLHTVQVRLGPSWMDSDGEENRIFSEGGESIIECLENEFGAQNGCLGKLQYDLNSRDPSMQVETGKTNGDPPSKTIQLNPSTTSSFLPTTITKSHPLDAFDAELDSEEEELFGTPQSKALPHKAKLKGLWSQSEQQRRDHLFGSDDEHNDTPF